MLWNEMRNVNEERGDVAGVSISTVFSPSVMCHLAILLNDPTNENLQNFCLSQLSHILKTKWGNSFQAENCLIISDLINSLMIIFRKQSATLAATHEIFVMIEVEFVEFTLTLDNTINMRRLASLSQF